MSAGKITPQQVSQAEQMIKQEAGRSLTIYTPETVEKDKQQGKEPPAQAEKKVEVAKQQSDKQKAAGKMHHGKEFAKVGKGENVAAGQQDILAAVKSWLNSPGHFKKYKKCV